MVGEISQVKVTNVDLLNENIQVTPGPENLLEVQVKGISIELVFNKKGKTFFISYDEWNELIVDNLQISM